MILWLDILTLPSSDTALCLAFSPSKPSTSNYADSTAVFGKHCLPLLKTLAAHVHGTSIHVLPGSAVVMPDSWDDAKLTYSMVVLEQTSCNH